MSIVKSVLSAACLIVLACVAALVVYDIHLACQLARLLGHGERSTKSAGESEARSLATPATPKQPSATLRPDNS